MIEIKEEFKTRVSIYDTESLRRFFLRYSFFSTSDMALMLGLSLRTIIDYKRRAGIVRKSGPYSIPSNHRIPVHIDLPDNWDTPEWWKDHYPRYGMHILTRVTKLNYSTVRRRVRKHCGGIRSYKESTASTHHCYTREWLQEHYVDKGLSQRKCAKIAGVSDHTVRSWLIRMGFQVRGSSGGSILDKIDGIRTV